MRLGEDCHSRMTKVDCHDHFEAWDNDQDIENGV